MKLIDIISAYEVSIATIYTQPVGIHGRRDLERSQFWMDVGNQIGQPDREAYKIHIQKPEG